MYGYFYARVYVHSAITLTATLALMLCYLHVIDSMSLSFNPTYRIERFLLFWASVASCRKCRDRLGTRKKFRVNRPDFQHIPRMYWITHPHLGRVVCVYPFYPQSKTRVCLSIQHRRWDRYEVTREALSAPSLDKPIGSINTILSRRTRCYVALSLDAAECAWHVDQWHWMRYDDYLKRDPRLVQSLSDRSLQTKLISMYIR